MENDENLLVVKHLCQYFHFKGGKGAAKWLKAVHKVSFNVKKGEVFGLVGESGCGKTTTGRSLMRLYPITSGDVFLDGIRIAAGWRWNQKEIKYVNLRAQKKVEELTNKIKTQEEDFIAAYYTRFGVRPSLTSEPIETEGDAKYSEKLELYRSMRAEVDPEYDEIEKTIANAKEVTAFEKKRIEDAKKANREFNKKIAEREVALVNEKYADIIAREANSKENPLTEEEAAKYKEYKAELHKAKKTTLANKVQMIFQDPIASLNPRMTVRNIIAEGLVIQGITDQDYIDSEVQRVLKLVGLVPEHANRYPHEFSGGQRQRIGIARAIIMKPELIIADEPVSALDVSVQAQVINLLNDLRNNLGLTIIFIAHNLSVVKYFCDRIAVMYYGNLVELASSDELFAHPLHPYTKSLLSAVPYPDPVTEATRQRIIYKPSQEHNYSVQKPSYREIVPGHFVYCNDEEAERYAKELKK